MIDEGYHPMTMYFPLVVHGAMLIEPTELELKVSLDLFDRRAARSRRDAAKSGDVERFQQAPRLAPRRRLDETKAAREPELTCKWNPSANAGPIGLATVRSRRPPPAPARDIVTGEHRR